MKPFLSILLTTFLFLNFACSGTQKEEAKNLFTDKGTNWSVQGDAIWQFEDDILTGDSSSGDGFVITKNKYMNFILTLEFKPDKNVNSGIFVRCKNTEMSATECHEINVWDNHPVQENRTGAIVTKTTPTLFYNTIGKWNAYKIKCENNKIEVYLNEDLVAEYASNPAPLGVIGLQSAKGGKISFKNIQLKKLQ
jgi:hypothetical protein|tara:strand:+ start:1679 stop:2260 length:582 start_codon:yes stop_codon:yes gene_type:complete